MTRLKPVRQSFTSKLSDLHDIYRGNSNHWSTMRTESDVYVAQERLKEREMTGTPTTLEADVNDLSFRDRAIYLRGQRPFYGLVLEGLGGELPGDLSKDNHKHYNMALIDLPFNIYRKNAKERFNYWWFKDQTVNLSKHPRKYRNSLPV